MNTSILKFVVTFTMAINLTPVSALACGQQFFAALKTEQSGEIKNDPALFIQQAQSAVKECKTKSESREKTGKRTENDRRFSVSLDVCSEMRSLSLIAGASSEIHDAACIYSASKSYSWDLVMEEIKK